ncbi:MAG TPA: DinB family protein [Fimbriimonadaceae bacterium]|nr:DinB family protein [Fimbriimonadaceae bacterium]
MTDFASIYKISHGRMLQSIEGLSDEQLGWRPHPKGLSIFEMLMHVAGGEMFFASRLQGLTLSDEDKKIESCARDKVINENPFPFSESEVNGDLLQETLAKTKALVQPMMDDPEPWREKQIETPLGPVDHAQGIFARIAQHPAYHTGQVWTYRFDPRFPS